MKPMSKKELIKALKPFAKLAALLDGNEFNNIYEISSVHGHAQITMQDLKNAQRALGFVNARTGETLDG